MAKSRQPIGTAHLVAVRFNQHRVVVKFRPDQRKRAKYALIRRCFEVGFVIPFEHPAFTEIDMKTWEPVA